MKSKTRFDWLHSRSVFELFRLLYFTDVNSVKGFEKLLLKDRSAISHQLKAMDEKDLIEGKVNGRDKTFKVNKPKLLEITKARNIKRVEAIIPFSKNFEELIEQVNNTHKKDIKMEKKIIKLKNGGVKIIITILKKEIKKSKEVKA